MVETGVVTNPFKYSARVEWLCCWYNEKSSEVTEEIALSLM